MALSTVSVILIEPVAVFEFGVAVEVFGLDRATTGCPPFDFRVCSVTPGVALETKNASPFTITASYGLDAVVGSDLVIVAATLVRDRPTTRPKSCRCCGTRTPRGPRCSACVLDRSSWARPDCSTIATAPPTGSTVDDMRAAYPLAKVDPRALFVDDGTVVTSAGTAAGIDACLHLVRRELGTAVANKIARRMVVPPQRDGGQQQFVEMPIPSAPRTASRRC
jgi:transcriptional regulator GlxA family with amidase domain